MELENKVMKLYEDILDPERERKIILLLKYIIVDGETDLNIIKNEIGIKKAFIERTIDDDSLLLKYFDEQELKKFRLKADNILERNGKLIRFIKVTLLNNETNLDKIMNLVPITIQTIKNYMANKEKMLRYLTEGEYNKLLNIIGPTIKPKTQIEKLIQAVMVDGKKDLESIEKEYCIKIENVKKYIFDSHELQKLLSQEEINLFINKINKMFEEKDFIEYQKDRKYVGQIINDLFDTRHLYADICAKHLFSVKKFEKYLYDEEFMKKEFPKITVEMIKGKIKENEKIRVRKPYDMVLVEDKYSVMITKKEVHYLTQFDMKKVNIVSYYLGTGANLDAVREYFKIEVPEALAILSSAKLKEILNEPYYLILNNCLNIENILYKNDLNSKKTFIKEIINFLETNNFDIQVAMEYYNIPQPLFNRIIEEIKKLPYASDLTKQTLENALSIEPRAKSK